MAHTYRTGFVVPLSSWKRYIEDGHGRIVYDPLHPEIWLAYKYSKKEAKPEDDTKDTAEDDADDTTDDDTEDTTDDDAEDTTDDDAEDTAEDDAEDTTQDDAEDTTQDDASETTEDNREDEESKGDVPEYKQEKISQPSRMLQGEAQESYENDMFMAYKAQFRYIRRAAPREMRVKLELPHSFTVDFGPISKRFIYIPTGAITKLQRASTAGPSDRDRAGMNAFIDAANEMLPDDAARDRAGFNLSQMKFVVVPNDAILPPLYDEEEYQEIKQLRSTRSRLQVAPPSAQ